MRFRRSFLATIPFVALLAAACGGTVTGAGGSGTTGTGAGTTTGGTGGASPSGCPAAAPAAGGICAPEGAQCSYGDSPIAECREAFSCTAGKWTATPTSCPPQSAGCPGSPPQDQASCEADAGFFSCGYPDGEICTCSDCPLAGPACQPTAPKWFCSGPPSTAGCPTLIPNEGTSCASPGLSCFYPSTGCGVGATCTSGAWVWQGSACPA